MRVNRVVIDSKAMNSMAMKRMAAHRTAKHLKAIRIGHSNVSLPKCFHFNSIAPHGRDVKRRVIKSKSVSQKWFTDGFSYQAQCIAQKRKARHLIAKQCNARQSYSVSEQSFTEPFWFNRREVQSMARHSTAWHEKATRQGFGFVRSL